MTVRACGTVDAKTVDAKLPLMPRGRALLSKQEVYGASFTIAKCSQLVTATTTLNCADWSGPQQHGLWVGPCVTGKIRHRVEKVEQVDWVKRYGWSLPLLLCPPPRIMLVGRV